MKNQYRRVFTLLKTSSLVFISLLVLSACGGGGGGDGGPSQQTGIIGFDGGVVSSGDGLVSLSIPSGALNSELEIEISIVTQTPSGNIAKAYVIEPSSTRVDLPAELELLFEDGDLPDGVAKNSLRIAALTDNQWQALSQSTVDIIDNALYALIEQFGTYGIVINKLPVANAGFDQRARVGDTITLDGSASVDGDGDELTYHWTIVSSPEGSTAELADSSVSRPNMIVDLPGTYTFQLIVNDRIADSLADTVIITTEANVRPVAHAGVDLTVDIDEIVEFDGSRSSDIDGDALVMNWSLVSIPDGSQALLSDENAVNPRMTVDVAGDYVAELVVSDGLGDSLVDQVALNTENSPPVAHAGFGQTAGIGNTVQLDGAASTDMDGDRLSFRWSLISVPEGSSAGLSETSVIRPGFIVDLAGTYVAQLVVNDGTVDSLPATVTINTENTRPLANAGVDQTALTETTVVLDGSASLDADHDTLEYQWALTIKPEGSQAALVNETSSNPAFDIDVFGVYVGQLIVDDGALLSSPDVVVVRTDYSRPIASAGLEQSGVVGDSIQLDGTDSSDFDFDTLDYRWSMIAAPDGSQAELTSLTSATTTFEADVAGLYLAQLIVADSQQESLPDTVVIEISENDQADVLTSLTTSPVHGEENVSLNRETVIRFSQAIAEDSTLDENSFDVDFAGQPLSYRAHLSKDRKTVSLFYQDTLPANARISVSVVGDEILDQQGQAVDADGDGIAGGSKQIQFDTSTLTTFPGTRVCGRVFASELAEGPGGASVNTPLQGATVTVDGAEETLNAVSDAAGNFCLDPAPAGRFFAHINGGTATVDVPEGAFYPSVGKPFEGVLGQQVNIGDVFLPLVVSGTLQEVSLTQATEITFPQTVLDAHPELEGVQITVPADALFSEDGSRGGRVGIAPVPADRLPGRLPPGLEFPLVITVQTDGASNFDTPVPACFPNLPDPQTGALLQPGEKTALWSFDHDKGAWDVMGTMTVNESGDLACTDEGVGISAPGWHSTSVSSRRNESVLFSAKVAEIREQIENLKRVADNAAENGTAEELATACQILAMAKIREEGIFQTEDYILDGVRGYLQSSSLFIDVFTKGAGGTAALDLSEMMLDITQDIKGSNAISVGTVGSVTENFFDPVVDNHMLGLGGLEASGSLTAQDSDEFARLSRANRRGKIVNKSLDSVSLLATLARIANRPQGMRRLMDQYKGRAPVDASQCVESRTGHPPAPEQFTVLNELTRLIEEEAEPALDEVETRALDLHALFEGVGDWFNAFPENPTSDPAVISEVLDSADVLIEGLNDAGALGEISIPPLDAPTTLPPSVTNPPAFAPQPARNAKYAVFLPAASTRDEQCGSVVENGAILRGTMSSLGVWDEILPPNACVETSFLDTDTGESWRVLLQTGNVGERVEVVRVLPMNIETEESSALFDADGDGLDDLGEVTAGTDMNNADTDGDGINDWVEIQQGTDPLDGLASRTGIIATADTPGNAVDLCVTEDLIAVADSGSGVALLNVFEGMSPAIIAQIDTGDDVIAVACSNNRVAAANGAGGLSVIDVSNPGAAEMLHQLDLGGSVNQVEIFENLIYASSGNTLFLIDARSGEILDQRDYSGGTIQDFTISGDFLYIVLVDFSRGRSFTVHKVKVGDFAAMEPVSLAVAGHRAVGRIHIAVSGEEIFLGNVNDNRFVAVPGVAVLADRGEELEFVGAATGLMAYDVAVNGSGLALYTGGDSGFNIGMLDVSEPTQTGNFLTSFTTPGSTQAVQLFNGLAYVADGAAGVQVINYLSLDTAGVAPEVNVTTSFANQMAEADKLQRISSVASDDVQVRHVEFFVDGEMVERDSSHPFDYFFTTPQLDMQMSFTFYTRTVDTAGNATTTPETTVQLVEDLTPPRIVARTPLVDSVIEENTVNRIAVTFNEEIDSRNIGNETLQLFSAGSDALTGTEDDVLVENGQVGYDAELKTLSLSFNAALPAEMYRVVLSSGVSDLSDNAMLDEVSWSFEVYQLYELGEVASGRISRAGEVDTVRYNVTAGQTVFFDHQRLTGPLIFTRFTLYAPDGERVFGVNGSPVNSADFGPVELTQTGEYRLLIDPTQDQLIDYQISLIGLDPVVVGDEAKAFNTPISDTFTQPGQIARYVFNATSGETIFFDHQVLTGALVFTNFSLKSPSGETVFLTNGTRVNSADTGPILLSETGEFELTINPGGDNIPAFTFVLWRLEPPVIEGGLITANQVVSGSISQPGQSARYTFNGTTGSSISFDHILLTGSLLFTDFRLTSPSGEEVFSSSGTPVNSADFGPVTLTEDGEYVFTIDPRRDAVPDYEFSINQ